MALGRLRADWDHTARLLWMMASCWSAGKQRYSIWDFHPYRERQLSKPDITVNMADIRGLICQGRQVQYERQEPTSSSSSKATS